MAIGLARSIVNCVVLDGMPVKIGLGLLALTLALPAMTAGIRSGVEHAMEALPFTEALEQIKDRLQVFTQQEFTHVLCNFYRDGQDSMGWHRDNEPVLGKNPTIASLTFGATRSFQLRPYGKKEPKLNLELSHGSLLLMGGESQHFWEHQLPKTKKVLAPRINLTFRKLIG